MTDNDKARDAAWDKQRESYEGHGCGEECYVRFHNAWHWGYETAIAHAEAQHAERVKELVDALEKIGTPLVRDREAIELQIIADEALAKYRGKE